MRRNVNQKTYEQCAYFIIVILARRPHESGVLSQVFLPVEQVENDFVNLGGLEATHTLERSADCVCRSDLNLHFSLV